MKAAVELRGGLSPSSELETDILSFAREHLAGYKVHYGQASREYSQTVDVGDVTTHTVTGGHVYTHEIDEGRAKTAEENFKKAGVDSLVADREHRRVKT